MKEELRKVPFKNYIILGIVLLVSMLILYYFYMWVDAYNESKLNKPIMDKYMEVINYNELDNYLIENPNTIIYVSVLENKEVRDFEKKFKKLFITNEINDKSVKEMLKERYSINSVSILNVPNIIVFDDGNLKTIYSISEDNYDIDRIKLFINNNKFSEEDELNG